MVGEWERLGIYTGRTYAVLGSRAGLATFVKEKNYSAWMIHRIINRQALASKTFPEGFSNIMKLVIKVVLKVVH